MYWNIKKHNYVEESEFLVVRREDRPRYERKPSPSSVSFHVLHGIRSLNFAVSSLVTFRRKTASHAAMESRTRAWLLHNINFNVTKLYLTNIALQYFAHFMTLFCVCKPCGRFLAALKEGADSAFKVRGYEILWRLRRNECGAYMW
jgi:hypothetical protein